MHTVTGFFFIGKKYVMYSTLYKNGRYASMHNREGLTDEQARGKFHVEHSREVDLLLKQEHQNKSSQSKIIV